MSEENSSSQQNPIPPNVSLAGSETDLQMSDFIVAKEPETKFDALLDRISDFCSSILVKETRQAIKSRQFFLTFMMLLTLVILWTFFALSPARINYEVDSLGAFMLCGFLFILGVPLVLIIPYTTFRSLAQEYEDGTIDMVLITTMKPWQIIAGKLGSALLQVMIYLAVLAPCISFCYLLRGVDISQIWLSLGGALVVTFGLCCLAIALASAADSNRTLQVLSVFLILGLLFAAWIWCLCAYGICFEPFSAGDQGFIFLMLSGPMLAWISSAVILFFAASAKIAFHSSNRSTMIRVGVTAQVVIYLGWTLAVMTAFGFHKVGFMSASLLAMHYLLLVGAMMIACHPGLSPRVRRTLPSTFAKKSVYSLYMPGPGRAFLFIVATALAISVSLMVLAFGYRFFEIEFDIDMGGFPGPRTAFGMLDCRFAALAIITNFVYFLFFFCLAFIISRLYAWRLKSRKPFVIEMGIIMVAIVFLAIIGSYAVAPRIFWGSQYNFELTQALNWYRIQYIATERSTAVALQHLLLLGVPTIAMLYICLRIAAPELSIARSLTPERITEEDKVLKRERIWGKEADEETIDEIFSAVRPDAPAQQ